MALTRCKECGREVSTKAEVCPHCGVVVKKKTSGCATLVAIIGGVAVVGYIAASMSGNSLAPVPSPQPSVPASRPAKEWYEGGTLHRATMREWHEASYENRLATSADFVAKLLQTDGRPVPPPDTLKPIAEDFERGMSKVASEPDAADQSAASVAATMWVLMHKPNTALEPTPTAP